ncbi:MAG: hypothetical protein VXZ82_20520 [Planctomycetota bacterium]|nr:hypothetical protein [Planctomycetota bacterium]
MITSGDSYPAATTSPEENDFQLLSYQSEVLVVHAYVAKEPEDGEKHP